MPTYSVEAFVLRHRDLGEDDKLLSLFTREHGRLSAIARGARKKNSPLGGSTDTLTFARFMLAKGRRFEYVTQAQPLRTCLRVRGDLERLAHAMVFAELLERTCGEEEPNEPAYSLALLLMELLDSEAAPACVLLWAELRLMGLLGYAPLLDQCARCHRPDIGKKVHFSPSAGGLVCAPCAVHLRDRLPLPAVAVEELRMLARATEPPEELRATGALRRVTRAAWRHVLESDLKSAQFLDELSERA
jgi:DNA repair protein RecO (recombination protein O)